MGMAKIVKTLLLERDMTLTDLAGKLGKTVQNMSAKLRYEKGNKIVFLIFWIGRRLQRPNHISGP